MRDRHSYSSLSLLAECAEKFRLRYEERLEPMGVNLPMAAGSALDAALNVLYTDEWKLAPAVEALRDSWGDTRVPLGAKHPWLTRDFLEARVALYMEERERSPTILETGTIVKEFSGVSHNFEWSVGGELVRLRGVPDFAVRDEAGRLFVPDLKCTTSWVNDHWMLQFRVGNQLRVYAAMLLNLLGEFCAGGLINAVYMGEKALDDSKAWTKRKSSPSMVNRVDFTSEQVEETHAWARGLIEVERACETAGLWPRNEKACGAYGGCEFLSLCTAPSANVRRARMMTKFNRRAKEEGS